MAYDSGAIAWMIMSTALVLIMTPAVGFFYGGMLKKNSMLSMLGQSLIIMGVATIIWVVFGFSLAFGADSGGLIGNLDFVLMNGIGVFSAPPSLPWFPTTFPPLLYMIFQATFAMVTVALIIGGIAERMRLAAVTVFLAIWTVVIYLPVAHWVWGGGWIFQMGALDFAGGTVVHITAGVSVLAATLVIGKRLSRTNGSAMEEPAHNIPLVVLGGVLLWLGWFGFNGGSALNANEIAVNAIAVTTIAAAVAGVVWGLISYLHLGRTSVLGMITGAVVGLVAITPACGFVDTSGAMVIGIIAPGISYGAIQLRKRLGFDDALDVWACHGMGGTFGALATGFLATSAVNPAVVSQGLLYGGGIDLLVKQLIAVGAVWAFVFVVAFVLMKALVTVWPNWRMTKEEERIGVDIVQHGENAYN